MRVTDWGGTSSAICLLYQIGNSGTVDIIEKIEKATEWLLADQAIEGSWEAAEMQCCEATAAVVFDLNETNLLSQKKLEKAINFIQSCYIQGKGYFISRPGVQQKPHIYTTYLAVRTLSVIGHISFSNIQKRQIINWIDLAKSADDKWNSRSQCIEGDVAHTIFALLILYYCGVSVKEIKRKYRKQIKWLQSKIKDCTSLSGAFSYEATEAYDISKSDSYGEGAFILKSYHFNTALLCHFFLKIKKMGISQRLIQKMIALRGQQEGWGLSADDKIFVWATQQAIDCMHGKEGFKAVHEYLLNSGKSCMAGFVDFFKNEVPADPMKAEYLIPTFIGELLAENKMSVKVLRSNDTWYGMTYKEDVVTVKENFEEMLKTEVYKEDLFSDL